MFKNTSKGGWGMAGFLVFGGLTLVGYDITTLPADLHSVSLGQVASVLLWMWGQISRGDLKFGFTRKETA